VARPHRGERPDALLSLRTTVILLLALLTAAAAAVLTLLAGRHWAEAALAGGATFAAAIAFFNQLIRDEP
jgi:hypothetical protein